MSDHSNLAKDPALEDFRRAHRQAAMQEIMARLTGGSTDLLSFNEVRQKFKLDGGSMRGVQEIPLDAIVGSVGRYNDFTRTFLPRQASDSQRWTRVKEGMAGLKGLPPIELYQIGQVYFVVDGNHRVSVARQLGSTYIQARVTEFKTKVPLEPDDRPDDLIIKAEYADFLERTHLDDLRPDADLQITVPGRYWELETHIEAHRYVMTQEQGREILPQEAIGHWYDNVYLPLVEIIRERGILRDFPGRTETDLYLWIFEHRATLEKQLGWHLDLEMAASTLAADRSSTPKRMVARLEEKVAGSLTPAALEAGPAPGQWREERWGARSDNRLFGNILVPISGHKSGWQALDQALAVARHEESHILGLHIVSSAEKREQAAAKAVQAEFDRSCQAAGIRGELSIESGPVVQTICSRARWADLIVMYPDNPPGSRLLSRIRSGSRSVIQNSSGPVLMVPGQPAALERALVAYDGSPKAREALFVAAYLANQWQLPLLVLTVIDQQADTETLAQAQKYLDKRGVTANFVPAWGEITDAIMNSAFEHDVDLIIMGGYGSRPAREVVLGSVVSQLLPEAPCPLLICR